MKVIKRDGRIVEFNKQKIITAIDKANCDVPQKEQAKKKDIDKIINYIESLDKKRILVEDIQDIIEVKLMELKKYELAKKYIVYRYNRALVRKQNTTDETILGLIRKNNSEFFTTKKNNLSLLLSTQRNLIAGEVSKDLTKRILLPEKINIACEEGKIYFHDREYFLQPSFNSSNINIKDMLDNGTVMNNQLIESPKSFQVACNVMTQIMSTIANSQYGEQSVNIKHLSKYLKISENKFRKQFKEKLGNKISDETLEEIVEELLKKELASGVQTIQYQLNTILANNGHYQPVTLFLELDTNSEYETENALIIEEILKQRCKGIKTINGINKIPDFPKIIYVLNDENCLNNGKYDYLTKLVIKCLENNNSIYFLSSKKMKEKYDNQICPLIGSEQFIPLYKEKDNYINEGRFNQGIVSINLPQIAIISNSIDELYNNLDERLDLCYEALMCRHYALLQTSTEVSPLHYEYGAISRLDKDVKIDNLLKNGYSTLTLGYIGLKTMIDILENKKIIEEKEEFIIEILKYIRSKLDKWKKNTSIAFNLYQTNNIEIINELYENDSFTYDLDNITSYENKFDYSNFDENLELETKIQSLTNGGMVINIDIEKQENIEELIRKIYNNVLYIKIN